MIWSTSITRTISPASWAGVVVALGLLSVPPAALAAQAGSPAWQPTASERLIKLPSTYLKKAIDRDFNDSELGVALNGVSTEIGLKKQTLAELQAAIERADGEVRTELRHQFLAEKQEFIKLMGRRQDLHRAQLKTRNRLYERVLRKLERRNAGATPAKIKLLEKQETARQRFSNSVSEVDMKLFDSETATQSKYGRDYSRNMSAIEELVLAVKEHPMNAQPLVDGQPLSKQDYLRQLVAESQAELAILDQEETILGYMAKLIALDAMALSEEITDGEFADVDGEDADLTVSSVVEFFTTR